MTRPGTSHSRVRGTALGGPAIETIGLTKHYGSRRALEGLDLVVKRGEVFGLLGPNGAGKTTTIRLLLGLIRPTRGEARVVGMDVRRDGLAVRRLVGYLPGDLRLPERPTARRFLAFLARLRGGVEWRAVTAIAERLSLDLGRRIGELSTGNRQKVGLVAAFMHDPEVLVLDEPTSGLDPLRRHAVLELIAERRAAGRTVLICSHDLDQVERIADRVGMIRAGRLLATEAISELKRRALRRVEVRFAEPVPDLGLLRDVPGVRVLRASDDSARVEVRGSMGPLIAALARLPVESLTSEAADLEEIFLSYYGHAREA